MTTPATASRASSSLQGAPLRELPAEPAAGPIPPALVFALVLLLPLAVALPPAVVVWAGVVWVAFSALRSMTGSVRHHA